MKSSSYEQRKTALIEEITAAFDGVSRQEGVTLHEATVIDNYGSLEERALARTQDTEDKWQNVPDRDIRFTNAVLSFLDPKGFHYYIPAYVVWYLRNIDNEDPEFWSNTFSSVIFHLSAGVHDDVGEYYLSKFKLFTLEQAKAIAHFLVFEAEREDAAQIAYKQQWRKSMSKEGFSPEELDDAWPEGEKFRIERGLPENDARRALERYWGQFL
ncbi:hypothetical protein H6F88_09250 [Oculatella sp. FACHB-28]|uniref:DUF6714 family protein n=1 Tax=Oculatella sp. FACHB-28 TaxID=2692845 RepID=UPI00168920FC|nr:DUF6714 family protein [Oculatella sp. FACHB-28]MBD2056200.1 hypothetical protein [Oculatella sp. FACHB-28]